MIKVNPKETKFCPGCPHKDLQLTSVPIFIINPEQKDTKTITILPTSKPKKVVNSLF